MRLRCRDIRWPPGLYPETQLGIRQPYYPQESADLNLSSCMLTEILAPQCLKRCVMLPKRGISLSKATVCLDLPPRLGYESIARHCVPCLYRIVRGCSAPIACGKWAVRGFRSLVFSTTQTVSPCECQCVLQLLLIPLSCLATLMEVGKSSRLLSYLTVYTQLCSATKTRHRAELRDACILRSGERAGGCLQQAACLQAIEKAIASAFSNLGGESIPFRSLH